MDYSAFRNSSDLGSAVSVNHKALITRALTKYPVDYALFRELLQNSADAQANSATIQFETTQPSFKASQVYGAPIKHSRFTNDGLDFAAEDWARSREIASGNPNEAKIGAFGVGFYSVFELTDEPLVHSGNKIMNFRYQGVQLHYHFTENTDVYQKGTLIDLPYKTIGELPDLVKFIGFSVQSFLLVNSNSINLQMKFGNGEIVNLLELRKHMELATQLSPPPGLQTYSPNKTLKMVRLQKSDMVISLKYLNVTQMPPLSLSKGLFSFGKQSVSSLTTDSADPEEYSEIKCNLIKVDCFADVYVSSAFRKQMIETLLKPPPKQAVLSSISFSQSEHNEANNQLKSYVLPEDFNDAKIFIGFPTKQSTGLRSHLALNQVIPTMERTAVDMSNNFVKDWNSEMLYMAGMMARCTYELESKLAQRESNIDRGLAEALEICSRFKFGTSAPDKVIGLYVRTGFWKSTNQTLVPSSHGILPNTQVRSPRDASKFLRHTPIVMSDELSEQLQSLDSIKPITDDEIIKDVSSSPLPSESALEFLKWLVNSWGSLDDFTKVKLVSAFKLLHLGQIYDFNDTRFYLDRSKLPDEEVAMHLPPSCLPSDLGNMLGHGELQILGIHPLDVISWATYRLATIERTANNTKSQSSESTSVIQVISRTWNRSPSKARMHLVEILKKHKCIPTQRGLQYPAESYIKEIRLFPQLPVVLTDANLPDGWLLEIGVRGSMDMAFVLDASNGNKLKWTNEDLLQYLDENSRLLTQSDWKILQDGCFFTRKASSQLYRARDLYPPDVRLEKSGLPTITLSTWNEHSSQAKVLKVIGSRQYPSLQSLFSSLDNSSKHDLALQYFVDNFEKAGYQSSQSEQYEVIPVTSGARYTRPSECYYDESVEIFDMAVMSQKWVPYASKLGVRKSPSVSYLLDIVLCDPPRLLSSSGRCEQIMSYFAAHIGEITDEDIRHCRKTKFIPVRRPNKDIEWCRPGSVFLPYKGTDAKEEDVMRPLLRTIQPSRQSLPFFQILGVSDRPTLLQLVNQLIASPASVFNLCPDLDYYEAILYQIDNKWATIAKTEGLIEKLKNAAFLIGKRHCGVKGEIEEFDVALYAAKDLVIVDDVVIFNQFKDKIIICPQDDILENLYSRIGVPRLSTSLKEKIIIGNPVEDERTRQYLEKRVNERLQLHRENTSKAMKDFKHINVTSASRIELQRQLPPHASIRSETSAYMHPVTPYLLVVAPFPNYEWIDVANALAKTVLQKPDQDSVVVLEVQLSCDLSNLEKKGYNVQRLRQSDTGVKEKSSKSILDESNSNNLPQTSNQPGTIAAQTSMSNNLGLPPRPNVESSKNAVTKSRHSNNGLFSSLKSMANSLTGPSTHSRQQAPTHPVQSNQSVQSGPGNVSQTGQRVPENVASALNRGLSSAKDYNNNNLDIARHVDPPPSVTPPSCTDPASRYQMQYVNTSDNGMKIFSKSADSYPLQDEYLLSYTILTLCDIFGYSKTAVNIYRENNSNNIAFNHNGSIFFNSSRTINFGNLLDYYYPVMAHELAHNLISDHGAVHSFYAESYIQYTSDKYMNHRH